MPPGVSDPSEDEAADAPALAAILALMSRASGLDLDCYKQSTLRRQVWRRCRALGLGTLEAYLAVLQADAGELVESGLEHGEGRQGFVLVAGNNPHDGFSHQCRRIWSQKVEPEVLQVVGHFLAEVFDQLDMKISIKTRSGKYDQEEFEELLDIYNQYPLEELILHPRVQQDYYKNKPDWITFAYACRNSINPLVYNGDIFCAEDYKIFQEKFPEAECIMLGRGILMNPFFPAVIKGKSTFDTKKIATFCDHLLDAYIEKSPEEIMISVQEEKKIIDAVAKMDHNYQKIIHLRFFEEKSIKEIAEELNLSVANTKVRIMRAKKVLAELLNENE